MIEEGLSYCGGSTIGEGEGKVNKRGIWNEPLELELACAAAISTTN